MKDVLFTSFESLPFIKVGGLADVVYALPKAINNKKYKVKVSIPLFKPIKDAYKNKLKYIDKIKIDSGKIKAVVNIYSCKNENIEYLFIDNNKYFNRKNVYGYKDDDIRFSLFCLSVIEMMIKLDYYPDICHEHDYHTSMIPSICKLKYSENDKIKNIKHVFTIHNLVYQGWYNKRILKNYFGFDKEELSNKQLLIRKQVNFMKAGINYADAVTTVSKTYSKEIQESKFGYGLNKLLVKNRKKLFGIVNGIDTSLFNPKIDRNIKYRYDISNYKNIKIKNKIYLQKYLGLEVNPNVLLIGMVSRLTFQKGADILLSSMKKILKKDVQIVILGTGETNLEKEFKKISLSNKDKFAFYCGYNESLAHQIYASIDLLLMPSLFEPCGISQLISMKYGTLPLVRETGGLKDTVIPFNKNKLSGTGFLFKKYNSRDFYKSFEKAYNYYYFYPKYWNILIKNSMKKDVSFNVSAKEYENIYNKILK